MPFLFIDLSGWLAGWLSPPLFSLPPPQPCTPKLTEEVVEGCKRHEPTLDAGSKALEASSNQTNIEDRRVL